MRNLPSVSLYIRITDKKGRRHYERVNRRNPQLEGGVYCLNFRTGSGSGRPSALISTQP
jgi:hypothetical protein